MQERIVCRTDDQKLTEKEDYVPKQQPQRLENSVYYFCKASPRSLKMHYSLFEVLPKPKVLIISDTNSLDNQMPQIIPQGFL